MKKIFLSVMIVGAIIASSASYGQEMSKREMRRAAREVELNQKKAYMLQLLESRNFRYIANELVSSGHAAISNIRLNSLYYLDVSPNRFTCYLPIYGMSSPVGRASILRSLDINNDDYEMTIKDTGKSGYNVEIVTRNNNGNSRYTFSLSIPADGKMSRLSVATDFQGPVSFSGTVSQ